MTRAEASELFIYDLAVRPEFQRQGVGRALIAALRVAGAAEGISEAFVPADNEDTHALDFYRAVGGDPAGVTMFSFSGAPAPSSTVGAPSA
jgi:aminoglycoside 3-N-acetyltransferase I